MEMNFKSIIGAMAIVGALNVNAAVDPSAVAEKLGSAAKVELIAESIEIIRAAVEEERAETAEAVVTALAGHGQRNLLLGVSAIVKAFPELAGNVVKAAVTAAPETTERVMARALIVEGVNVENVVSAAIAANPLRVQDIVRTAGFIAGGEHGAEIVSAITSSSATVADAFLTSDSFAQFTSGSFTISLGGSTFDGGSIVVDTDPETGEQDVTYMQPAPVVGGGSTDREADVVVETITVTDPDTGNTEEVTVISITDGDGNKVSVNPDAEEGETVYYDQYGNPIP